MRFFRPLALVAASLSLACGQAAMAQVETIDPNTAIDGDLAPQGGQPSASQPAPVPPGSPGADYATPVGGEAGTLPALPPESAPAPAPAPSASTPVPPAPGPSSGTTYREDDLIGAAEGVFGKGAKGLAELIRDLLKKQGEPNAYIAGREAGGALVVGVRYGSGTLHHRVEGERPVYWTGPSIGFDAGANAASTFVLVYNLYDSQELYERFPGGEGQAYLVGGFHVSYLRRGDVVLIPVRAGAGLRLGINAGYMKFSDKQKWLPF